MASLEGMRDENGKLVSYVWPGGYPVFYYCCSNPYYPNNLDTLCPDCANKEEAEQKDVEEEQKSKIVGCDPNWEDPDLYCDQCNQRIESAYAEPDEDTEEKA